MKLMSFGTDNAKQTRTGWWGGGGGGQCRKKASGKTTTSEERKRGVEKWDQIKPGEFGRETQESEGVTGRFFGKEGEAKILGT